MRSLIVLAALAASAGWNAHAQQGPGQAGVSQDSADSRGVARISVLQGEVSVKRGDTGEQIAATINAPLVALDRLITGPGGRSELQFDFANMIRLGANTEVRLAELQYKRFQLNIPVGLVTYRVWDNSDAEVDLNTPTVSIRPLKRGEYRINVLEDGSTEVTVREGEVELFTPQGTRRLKGGRTLLVRGTNSGNPEFQTLAEIPNDSWDQWNRSRDRELSASRSRQYVPRDVYGTESLDPYGEWVYSAPYGYVWSPRVAVGWSPYRNGRWAWLDWYGWSWVSYDPWGWAPYHYGRWFWNANRWCWWPGAVGPRHYWSPALVSFFGFGRGGFNVGIGFGWGNVGWVPLAPFETFNPWWGPGRWNRNRGFNNITIVNNTNIYNIYRNARVNNGVTYVEANNFNRGSANNYRAASQNDIQNASEFRGGLGIAPSRESARFSNAANDGVRGGGVNTRDDQRFTARREAAPVERLSFTEQQRGMESAARSSGFTQADGVRGNSGGARADSGRTDSGRELDGGSRVFGADSGGNTNANVDGARGGGFVRRDSGVRGSDSNGFTSSDSAQGVRGGSGARGGDAARGSDGGFIRRDSGARGADSNGWDRFGDANSSGARGGGFVQRDSGGRDSSQSFDGGSRGRGVGAPSSVDVSPRMIERGGDRGGSSERQGTSDPFGGGVRGGGMRGSDSGSSRGESRGESRGGWGGFGAPRDSGGSRGGGTSDPFGGGMRGNDGGGSRGGSMRSPDSGGFGGSRGGGMSAPSDGGFGGSRGGSMRSPDGGSFGGSRGGGMSAPSGGGGFGGSRGGGMSAPSGGGGGSRGGSMSAPSGGGGSRGGGGGRRN